MKIPAPNYTQTPNVLFDELLPTLNEGELKIILVIMRQTFGWHKLEDWITINMLCRKTGLEARGVKYIVKRLIEKNLIRKRIQGPAGQERCYYSLVTEGGAEMEKIDPDDGIENEEEMEEKPDSPQEKTKIKKSYTGAWRCTGGVHGGAPGGVHGGAPTKETVTKETRQNIVCSAPLVGAAQDKKFVHSCELKHPDRTKYTVSLNDIFTWAVMQKKDFTTQEIHDAWDVLSKGKQLIRDPYHFIEGTIKNLRKSKAHEIIAHKEKQKCKTTQTQEEISKSKDAWSKIPKITRNVCLGDVLRGHL